MEKKTVNLLQSRVYVHMIIIVSIRTRVNVANTIF